MPRKKEEKEYKDIFDFIDDIFEQMENEMREFEKEFQRFTEEGGKKGGIRTFGPYVYGFRVTVGPDGKPKIEEFGNVVKKPGKERLISEEREPLVDVIEKGDEIRIVAEIPGVEKDSIKVKVIGGDKLVIQATSEDRKYYKEVELPAEVDEKTAKATYKNGVLEVILKKKQPKEEGGTDIKVE